jgi:putative CocE/NonD family hydrolase
MMNTPDEIRLLHGCWVPMRDGIRLSTDVYLPRSGGPFPTVVTRTPYESGRDVFVELGVYWAERGYAFVVQDCRGRFESEGLFHAYFPEIDDGYDTIEWVANQSWCDGKIGTWGRSYGACTQWLSAPLASPHLTCMAPHVICDDYFGDCHYTGGAFQLLLSLGIVVVWEASLSIGAGSQSGRLYSNNRFWSHLPLIDMDELAIGRKCSYWREWLEHSTYDEYWKQLNTLERHDTVRVPAFHQCGWYDPYAGAGLRNFSGMVRNGGTERARTQQRVLVGPWSHEPPDEPADGEMDFGPSAMLDIKEEDRRWFDWQLRGVDDGIAEEPPVRIFTTGTNRWSFADEWPLPDTETIPYFLHSNGRANTDADDGRISIDPPSAEPPDQFEYDPRNPAPSLGGNVSSRLITAHAEQPLKAGPVDQGPIEHRDDVLVYTSDPLGSDLEVTGPIEVILYAESSARDTDFVVRLTDVNQAGRSLLICEGILRGRYRKGLSTTELLEQNQVDEFRIDLCPASHAFLAGHSIRVHVTSSNFPRFSRNLNTGEDVATGTRILTARNTVLHTMEYPSHILLPISKR